MLQNRGDLIRVGKMIDIRRETRLLFGITASLQLPRELRNDQLCSSSAHYQITPAG